MNGVWIAIFTTTIIKGAIMAFWFKRGRWEKRKFALAKTNPVEFVDIR